jgi:hypothetical protein
MGAASADRRGDDGYRDRRVRSYRPVTPVRRVQGKEPSLRLSDLAEPLKIEVIRSIALVVAAWGTTWATVAKRSRRHSHNCCASKGQSHRHVHTH